MIKIFKRSFNLESKTLVGGFVFRISKTEEDTGSKYEIKYITLEEYRIQSSKYFASSLN